jgi:hypothetical protein
VTFGAEVTAAVANQVTAERQQLQALVGGSYIVRRQLKIDLGVVAGHFTASPRVGLQLGFAVDLQR